MDTKTAEQLNTLRDAVAEAIEDVFFGLKGAVPRKWAEDRGAKHSDVIRALDFAAPAQPAADPRFIVRDHDGFEIIDTRNGKCVQFTTDSGDVSREYFNQKAVELNEKTPPFYNEAAWLRPIPDPAQPAPAEREAVERPAWVPDDATWCYVADNEMVTEAYRLKSDGSYDYVNDRSPRHWRPGVFISIDKLRDRYPGVRPLKPAPAAPAPAAGEGVRVVPGSGNRIEVLIGESRWAFACGSTFDRNDAIGTIKAVDAAARAEGAAAERDSVSESLSHIADLLNDFELVPDSKEERRNVLLLDNVKQRVASLRTPPAGTAAPGGPGEAGESGVAK